MEIWFFFFENVLKFSDLVKDVLIPVSNEVCRNKMSAEQESVNTYVNTFLNSGQYRYRWRYIYRLFFVFNSNNFQFSNYSLSNNFPPINLFSSDDDVTVQKLVEFLDEFNRKRESILLVALRNLLNNCSFLVDLYSEGSEFNKPTSFYEATWIEWWLWTS